VGRGGGGLFPTLTLEPNSSAIFAIFLTSDKHQPGPPAVRARGGALLRGRAAGGGGDGEGADMRGVKQRASGLFV
jgi:hypothetical protein